MKGEEIKRIREKLEFNREEFSEFLCLSGYQSMANIETDFRKASQFTVKFLRHLDAIPKPKAKALIEEMNRHDSK